MQFDRPFSVTEQQIWRRHDRDLKSDITKDQYSMGS